MFDTVEAAGDGPFGSVDDRLAWLVEQPPSAVTQAVLEALADMPLTETQRMLVAKAWDRQLSAVHALASTAKLAAVTGARDGAEAVDVRDAELALLLRRTDAEMNSELWQARRLAQLPVLRALLRGGQASLRHLHTLVHLTRHLDDADAAEVDAQVSHRAASMTAAAFRRVARRVIAKLDRRSPAQRARDRAKQVGVKSWPGEDGLVTLGVTMPAVDGIAALNALNAAADALRTKHDPRTHGQRQVDALLAALGVTGTDTSAPQAAAVPARRRAEVQVVIDWRDLLGLRDHPGELLGHGPIPAADVARLLTQPGSVLRRLVTDPVTGVLLDSGRTHYVPDDQLRRLLAARDLTCRYPGCTRNAIWCDHEHCQPHTHGGPTSASNCSLMCRHHHRRKTFHGFTYTRPDPATGQTRWRTPHGFTITQEPAAYPDGGPDPGDTKAE